MGEFGAMDKFVESLSKVDPVSSSTRKDHAQFAILKFDGLSKVEQKHGRSSSQYLEASQAFKAMLSVGPHEER